MRFTRRLADWLTRSDQQVPPRKPLTPPSRDNAAGPGDPLTLIPVWRALQVITGALGQLPLVVERQGKIVTGSQVPAHIRRPDPDLDRSDWIEQATLSLAMDGNLFIRRITGPDGALLAARILPPTEVTITRDQHGRPRYHHNGTEYGPAEVNHQALLRTPGALRGLGPIQAARHEVAAATDVRDFATQWFRGTGQPTGLLAAKGIKTKDEAKAIRDRWNEAAADPDNPSGIRVIGGDTSYTPLLLNPEDAQWLEVRQFTVTDFARLFGIPSSLMLAAVEGTSQTYANVEQEWIAFVRFTLMSYVRKIEEALTALTPLGQTVRFRLDVLQRTDTKGRYDAYAVALAGGWLTLDEVRDLESLPALDKEPSHA